MKITGSYTLNSSDPARVYRVLQDPVVLARCMPGCESLEKTEDDEYAVKLKMVIAAFSGLFAGKVRIADRNEPASFRLIVEGTGKIGFLKGDGLLQIAPKLAQVDVAYDGDVQIGGSIAAVGQRLVDTTSKMMIKRFFEQIQKELDSGY